jgi:hypothetical protein
MCVGEGHVSFAITDTADQSLCHLSYFSGDIHGDELAAVFSENAILNRQYDAVEVSYHYRRSVLVPMMYYNRDHEKSILDGMHGPNAEMNVVSETVNEWQFHNVYAVPAHVMDWVDRKFPLNKSRHHITLAIKSMPAEFADRLLVDIHTSEFSFIAIKENKLLVAQTHPYSSPEDILYFLLKACHQFSLSQEKVLLLVSGLLEKESQLYREMYQFFININFREQEWIMGSGEELAYPAHYFTTLNDLAKCAS